MPLLYGLDLFGVAIFAITGCLRVREKRLDLFGVLVIAVVTAVGGGTTRDILMDIRPIFWIRDINYIYVALLAAGFTFVMARRIAFPWRLLLITDAIGLSVAAILGVQAALNHGASLPIAIMMGMISGTMGGVIRDMLSNEIPLIFGSELYATAALTGAAVFVLVYNLSAHSEISTMAGMLTVLILRLAAIRYRIMLPQFTAHAPR